MNLNVLPIRRAARPAPEELFEAAVLFTDIRRSSDLAARLPPREFFRLLNARLSAQAGRIRDCGGEVVKYTGDGVLAMFRGADRCDRALQCALALAAMNRDEDLMPFGTGVAEGAVLCGLVGPDDPVHARLPDIIGAAVHLAARLCALAGPGDVVATRAVHAASGVAAAAARSIGPVAVRGFPDEIDCVAFDAAGAGGGQPVTCARTAR